MTPVSCCTALTLRCQDMPCRDLRARTHVGQPKDWSVQPLLGPLAAAAARRSCKRAWRNWYTGPTVRRTFRSRASSRKFMRRKGVCQRLASWAAASVAGQACEIPIPATSPATSPHHEPEPEPGPEPGPELHEPGHESDHDPGHEPDHEPDHDPDRHRMLRSLRHEIAGLGELVLSGSAKASASPTASPATSPNTSPNTSPTRARARTRRARTRARHEPGHEPEPEPGDEPGREADHEPEFETSPGKYSP